MPNSHTQLADMYPFLEFVDQCSTMTQDFKVIDLEDGLRGAFYPENNKSYIYLQRHQTDDEIISTCVHETEHGSIENIRLEMDADTGWLEMNGQEEHNAIRNMTWCHLNWDKNTYYSVFNGENIKPKIKEKDYIKLTKKYNKLSDQLENCQEE